MSSLVKYESKLKEERASQYEFFVVVLMVGLALNLVATLLWSTIEGLSTPTRVGTVIILFCACILLSVFLIYYRPHTSKLRRYYCSYYFLPILEGHHYQIIRRNSLTSGPILRHIGQDLNWKHFDASDIKTILDPIIPFLALEPLILVFHCFWSHDKEMTAEYLDVIDPDGRKAVSVSQEKLGGKLLGPEKLWRILSKDIPNDFFISDFFADNFDADLRLKIPPRAHVDVIIKDERRVLQIDTPHMTIFISGDFIAIPSDISFVDMQFTCKIKHKLFSRFRSDYESYFIWEHSIIDSLEDYFNGTEASHSPNLESLDPIDTLVSLIVGDKKNRIYFWSMHGTGIADKIRDIPMEDRVFFKSRAVAEKYGFKQSVQD